MYSSELFSMLENKLVSYAYESALIAVNCPTSRRKSLNSDLGKVGE